MAYKFRNAGPWGPGQTEDLDAIDVDNNFWQAIQDIQAKAAQGVGISNAIVAGNQLTFVLTDHTLLGPYTLPVATLNFRGEWQSSTDYLANDIITEGGSTYIVLLNHVSESTFDPGANDGLGHDFYGLLLSNPASTIPTGGATGSFLRKASIVDYAVAWEGALLDDLSDVLLSTPALNQVLTYVSGHWINAAAVRALDDLSDVNITSPVNGQELKYSSGFWINVTPAVGTGINIVATLPLATGEPLVYTGTNFTNKKTVDLPYQNTTGASGSVTIDRANGEVQSVTMTGDTTLSFSNWPSSSQFARLVLRVINSGSHVITWPTIAWAGGIIPIASVSATDVYIFYSFDAGATVYGNVVGMNYF